MIEISLKAARVNKGLKQADVAKELGITVNTLISWEKGTTEPKMSEARRLANLYGLPMDAIFIPSRSNKN